MPTTAPTTAPATHQFIKAIVNPAAPADRTQDYKCEWCKCEDQIVKTKPNFQQETCGSFTSADCKTSVWAEWSTCSFKSGTCGIGTKTRMKKCSITITGGAEITQVKLYRWEIRIMIVIYRCNLHHVNILRCHCMVKFVNLEVTLI